MTSSELELLAYSYGCAGIEKSFVVERIIAVDHVTFDVTEQNFGADVLQSSLPVLVEFTADWCPPCKMIAPILHQIALGHEDTLRVGMLDADANPDLVQQYQVMGLPTLLLFVNGKPVERMIGFMPRERIEAKVVPHLAAAKA